MRCTELELVRELNESRLSISCTRAQSAQARPAGKDELCLWLQVEETVGFADGEDPSDALVSDKRDGGLYVEDEPTVDEDSAMRAEGQPKVETSSLIYRRKHDAQQMPSHPNEGFYVEDEPSVETDRAMRAEGPPQISFSRSNSQLLAYCEA